MITLRELQDLQTRRIAGLRPAFWQRTNAGIWRPVWRPIMGGSELAVLRQPTSVTITIDPTSMPGLNSTDLWVHGGSRTIGAGGAGQFSGLGDTYDSDQAANTIDQLQILYLRLFPTVSAILRLYYNFVTVFGGSGDLANLATNAQSNTGAPAGQNWGFEDWTSTTATPDTSNIPNHGGQTTRLAIRPLQANVLYEWALTGVPLFGRVITGDNAGSMGWGCWAAATVTAITVDYTVIVRKVPA